MLQKLSSAAAEGRVCDFLKGGFVLRLPFKIKSVLMKLFAKKCMFFSVISLTGIPWVYVLSVL